jgi:glycosyltransferase involved in cell wall biosynthesis
MSKSLVSVIIPVYNAGAYLRPSVESILSQTYSILEVLIIDDGSTDGCIDTIADIKDSRIRIIIQKHEGRSSAMNRGLDELSGDFYIAQDADDVSHPCRVDRQVQYLLRNRDLAAVFTGHGLIINHRHVAQRFAAKNVQDCSADIERFRMPAIGATAMYRVSMVSDFRFEPTLKLAEDLDYILRIGEQYPLAVLGDCLYFYRIHKGASTKQDPILNRKMEHAAFIRACRRRGIELDTFESVDLNSKLRSLRRRRNMDTIPHFIECILDLRRTGQNWHALKTAVECLRLRPFDLYHYKPMVFFIIPIALISYYRTVKGDISD